MTKVETIGTLSESQKIWAICAGCDRQNWLKLEKMPADLPLHEVRGYLFGRCCEGRPVGISIIWETRISEYHQYGISTR